MIRMKSKRRILEVLFPKVRAEMLRLLFSKRGRQCYVSELRDLSGLALCTVQDELRKLHATGLVTSWSNRYHRFYRANPSHPFFGVLVRMVQVSVKVPPTNQSSLHRRSSTVRRRKPKPARLPPDRPMNWHLLSRRH